MAEDPNLLLRIRIEGDDIKTYWQREMEWTERSINALLGVVLNERRFRDALFQRIIDDNAFRNEILTRINNGETSMS